MATTLQAEIQPEVRVRIESQPTSSSEAYNLHLEAMFQWNLGIDEGRQNALELWEKAIQIDPEFATAYAQLGYMKSMFTWQMAGKSLVENPAEALEIATPYLQKALEIDPNNLFALGVLSDIRLWYEWDFEAAEELLERIQEIDPSGSKVSEFSVMRSKSISAVIWARTLPGPTVRSRISSTVWARRD